MVKIFGLFVLLFGCSQAVIVPQELPSILSLVYSNIPPIKKGTDSRVGFGFRLGEHADFQVMLELGPQTETRKIGGSSGASKRNVDQQDSPKPSSVKKSQNKEGASWLSSWSTNMEQKKRKKASEPLKKSTTTSTTIRTVPLISESALKQLQLLFNQNPSEQIAADDNSIAKKSDKDQKEITAELMDVNLE